LKKNKKQEIKNKKVNKSDSELKDMNVTSSENCIDEKTSYWNRLYAIVFLFLVLQVIFYYFITKYFN